MKKLFFSVIAMASMCMVMTSCNKEEATSKQDIQVSFEDNEVMNSIKTSLYWEEGSTQYTQLWKNGDRIAIFDANSKVGLYQVNTPEGTTESGIGTFTHLRDWVAPFDANNAPLSGCYPTSIFEQSTFGHVTLPSVQMSNNGTIVDPPLYAIGDLSNLQFRNLCALVVFSISGDVQLDSISITTDKYINGTFKVNMNAENVLSYQRKGSSIRAHGIKTNTLRFRSGSFQTTSEPQEVIMYLPAQTYNVFDVTFYSNGRKLVKRNKAAFTAVRTQFNRINGVVLNSSDFEDFTDGTIKGLFNVGESWSAPSYVQFSQGNLEYIAKNHQYWHFADNQFDARNSFQYGVESDNDRDLFAWGANGYYVNGHYTTNYGNNIPVFGQNRDFPYYTGNNLNATRAWGTNKIVNGGNELDYGWRTLTYQEMYNLLDNHTNSLVTLQFVGKTGLVFYPDGYMGVLYPDGTSLSKQEWNALESWGCVFFVAENYRHYSGALRDRIDNTRSFYWLQDLDHTTENIAVCFGVNKDMSLPWGFYTSGKNMGAYVRLVKDHTAL